MNNVVVLSKPNSTRLVPESNLYFDVYERPLAWKDKFDKHHAVADKKVLLRMNDQREPMILGIVGSGYKTVLNLDLFDAVEGEMRSVVNVTDVKVLDKMSYNGGLCIRDYRFPSLRSVDQVAFRVIVINGFGGSSFKLIIGAIDFFCTNGMIIGEHDLYRHKHTAGLQIGNVAERVKNGIDRFTVHGERIARMQKVSISCALATGLLNNHFSKRTARAITAQFVRECSHRGDNLWALYSAMTVYATHWTADVRTTGADHHAATMINRERAVAKVVASRDWMLLETAA